MSRARDDRNAEAQRRIAARRNSPAHRGLRKRAGARERPDAVVADGVTAEQSVVETAVVETPAISPLRASLAAPAAVEVLETPEAVETSEIAVQEQAAPTAISPYPVPEPDPTDPTPTESFAIALGSNPPKKRRRWLGWLGVLAIVLVAYGAAAFFLRDAIPSGTTIEGVPAGDTVAEATKITRDFAAIAAQTPITLTAGDASTTMDATTAGLSVDVDATVSAAGGFTLDPSVLWHRWRGEGTDHDVVVAVAEPAFTDAVNAAADQLDSNRADASVTITGASAVVTEGSQAITVDRNAAREDILAVWPTKQPVALTAEVSDPDVTTQEAKTLAAALNAHVFAGPTTLTGPNGDAVIPAALVASSSTITAQDGALVWSVQGQPISDFILTAYPKIENEPGEASYYFTKAHKLKVTTGEVGRQLDVDSVDDAVIAAGKTTSRSAPIPYIETQPEVTAEDLPTQDFTTLISHFRTPLTPEPVRTKNLVRAAELITGTVIKPGEDFDLTKTIGPVTAQNGYFQAHVIVNGVLTNGIGGGLSQMATTTYNAGYFAGYHDVTHRPHSVWFPRYPAGRESTIYVGQINVVFTNTTPYAAIMNSYVENGYLYVDIWSTPYYTVKTKASPKTNFVQPHVVEVAGAGCVPKGNGEPGFKITNTRWVYHDDELIEKRSWTWTYKPDNGQKCTG
jgi:vancomycin resistance protein YoaR